MFKYWKLGIIEFPCMRKKICEIYYDKNDKPIMYCKARLIDKIRFWKDWWNTLPIYSEDIYDNN